MNLEIKKLLQDILDSIALIEHYLIGIQTLQEYKKSPLLMDAVERRLAIIGEALWKATKLTELPGISDQKKIISLRHILVHDYDLIEDDAIWIICKKHIGLLKKEAAALLEEAV
jgi:uncharacterized protein with HEPN domain